MDTPAQINKTRTFLPLFLSIFFSISAFTLLVSGGSELKTALFGAYRIIPPRAQFLVLLIGLYQFLLASLWWSNRLEWAKSWTIFLLICGGAHISYLLLARINLSCGCSLKHGEFSPIITNILSLVKNAVLIGMTIFAKPIFPSTEE